MLTFAELPAAEPPPGSTDRHGGTERIGETRVTHWFVRGGGITWHVATAGHPSRPAMVLLHGFPESWYAWCHQIRDLADQFFVIAFDLPGYGQSDKRLEIDYDYAAVARALGATFDALDIQRFHLVTHDRGTVIADHLCSVPGFADRMRSYVRMQQSGCEPHSEPVPPHELFRSEAGARAFANAERFLHRVYRDDRNGLVAHPIDEKVLERLTREWSHPGVAEGASASFASAGFDRELRDRLDRLFAHMTMPVLFLQGRLDPGQQPHEYEHVCDFVANGTLEFIDAGHFLHLESPDGVTAAIRRFASAHDS